LTLKHSYIHISEEIGCRIF